MSKNLKEICNNTANQEVVEEMLQVFNPPKDCSISNTKNVEFLRITISKFRNNREYIDKKIIPLVGNITLGKKVNIKSNFVVVLLTGRLKTFNKIKPHNEILVYENCVGEWWNYEGLFVKELYKFIS